MPLDLKVGGDRYAATVAIHVEFKDVTGLMPGVSRDPQN